ncbi:MAG: hypothetical protein ACOYIK_07515 [Coriobacteriales bacterium]|jgi:hypothetical protein
MPVTQMNIRIDSDLKKSGDMVFSQLGLSPTEVVRLIWSYADRNRKDLSKIEYLVVSLRDGEAENNDDPETQIKELGLLVKRKDEILQSFGIEPEPAYEHIDGEDLDQALAEQIAKDNALREQLADERLANDGEEH